MRWEEASNLPHDMGLPRWEVAGNETGRRIYHRRRDVQDGKWQVMRREDEFTTGDGTTSKMPCTASSGMTNSGTINFAKQNALGSTTGGRQWEQQNREETQKNTKRVGRE